MKWNFRCNGTPACDCPVHVVTTTDLILGRRAGILHASSAPNSRVKRTSGLETEPVFPGFDLPTIQLVKSSRRSQNDTPRHHTTPLRGADHRQGLCGDRRRKNHNAGETRRTKAAIPHLCPKQEGQDEVHRKCSERADS